MEIGDGMPGEEAAAGPGFERVEKARRGLGKRTAVERHIQQNIQAEEKNHKYFFASCR